MGWIFNAPADTPTWGPQIVAIAVALTSVSFIICCLRMYVRVILINAMGADDWSILWSWVGIFVYAVTTILQTKWGLGITQLEDMPPENIRNFLFIQYIGSPFYILCLFGFKLSLLMSYLRFVQFGFWNIATKVTAVIITLAHIVFELGFIFNCNPVAKSWDPSITGGSCLGIQFFTGFSALTISFDITIMLLPFPVLFRIQARTRKKAVLFCLFALGIFITVVQIIRFRTIQHLSNLLDSAGPITWSVIEGNLGIITTCIPTLAPMVKYFSERSTLGRGSGRERSGMNGTGSEGADAASSYALKSFRSGLRASGSAMERAVVVNGRHNGESTELIYDTSASAMKADAESSNSRRPS